MTDFSHVRRLRDPRFPHEIASILPGEVFVSAKPMVVCTILGSCVSVCVRDPVVRVGGMTHFMVLAPKGEGGRDSVRGSARHGRCAVERLIDDIVKQGGQKSRLEVKLFGGGQLFEGPSDAGRITVDWTLDFLRSEGLSAAKADVGGASLRTIYYLTDSGIVLLKKAGLMSAKSVIDQEAAYENSLKNELVAGAGTRF